LLTVGLIVLVVVVWLVWWQSDRLCAVLCGDLDAAAGGGVEGEIPDADEPSFGSAVDSTKPAT
jgi:hypothetical protein